MEKNPTTISILGFFLLISWEVFKCSLIRLSACSVCFVLVCRGASDAVRGPKYLVSGKRISFSNQSPSKTGTF